MSITMSITQDAAETEKKADVTRKRSEPLPADPDQMSLLSSRLGQRVHSEALNQRKRNTAAKKETAAPAAVAAVAPAANNDSEEDKERALEVTDE
jgi:hypothetical protein